MGRYLRPAPTPSNPKITMKRLLALSAVLVTLFVTFAPTEAEARPRHGYHHSHRGHYHHHYRHHPSYHHRHHSYHRHHYARPVYRYRNYYRPHHYYPSHYGYPGYYGRGYYGPGVSVHTRFGSFHIR